MKNKDYYPNGQIKYRILDKYPNASELLIGRRIKIKASNRHPDIKTDGIYEVTWSGLHEGETSLQIRVNDFDRSYTWHCPNNTKYRYFELLPNDYDSIMSKLKALERKLS